MKILFLTQDSFSSPGGIAVFLHNICVQLCQIGHTVDVLLPMSEISLKNSSVQPYRMHQYASLRHLSSLAPICRTLALHQRHRYDVIVVGQFMTTQSLGVVLVSRFFRIPYVILVHGYDLDGYFQMSRIDNVIARFVLTNASWVLANSSYTRQRAIELGYDLKKVTVVNPGVDINRFKPGIENSGIRFRYGLGGNKVILTVSRLVERKGHADILRALPDVIARVPNVIYLIAGTGPEKHRLEAMVEKLSLNSYVVFTGSLPDQDLPGLFCACDVFAMPSIEVGANYEGFGIVFIEASACAKPVIGTNSGGIPDAISNGVTGILTEPGDIQELSQALITLLTDAEHAHTLGVNGRKRAEKQFSWEKAGEKFNTVLNNLNLSGHSRNSCQASESLKLTVSLQCPRCRGILDNAGERLICSVCKAFYPMNESIPSFSEVNPFYEGKFAETEPDLTESTRGIAGIVYNFYRRFSQSHMRNRFIARMMRPVRKTCSVLDIGCGGGSRFLAKMGYVVGVDLSMASLRNAQKIYSQVVHADISSMPFPDGFFDFIVSRDVLGRIPSEQKGDVYQEMFRLCKAGRRVIHTIEIESGNPLSRFAKKYPQLFRKYLLEQYGHYGLEAPEGACRYFEEAGFRSVKIKPIFKTGIVWANYYISAFDNEYCQKSKLIALLVIMAKFITRHKVLRGVWNFMAGIVDSFFGTIFPANWAQLLLVCFEKDIIIGANNRKF